MKRRDFNKSLAGLTGLLGGFGGLGASKLTEGSDVSGGWSGRDMNISECRFKIIYKVDQNHERSYDEDGRRRETGYLEFLLKYLLNEGEGSMTPSRILKIAASVMKRDGWDKNPDHVDYFVVYDPRDGFKHYGSSFWSDVLDFVKPEEVPEELRVNGNRLGLWHHLKNKRS